MPSPKNPLKHLHPSDLRAAAQLATQATQGVARIAEGVHHSVLGRLGLAGTGEQGQTSGLTGLVYGSVRGAAQLVGKGLQAALSKLEPWLLSAHTPLDSPERAAVLAALGGVLGDHLAATNNPLATPMTLRFAGQVLDWQRMPPKPELTGKVLILIHGLCMNDLQWRSTQAGLVADHGLALAQALGYTSVYLRYNTGLHISQNGHLLSHALEQLAAHWPIPLQEISVLAHSMGGLVIRSAVYAAGQDQAAWARSLKNMVFLGTPHHGAPLEKAGNWIDAILGSTAYSKPFAKLGQLRSSGITDLRYGYVVDEDWRHQHRFHRTPDSRQPVPLPTGVASYTVAATVAAPRSLLAQRLLGDGLVPLRSALGQHSDAKRSLAFAKASQYIAYRTNHLQLLSRPQVAQQVIAWLTPA
ncbi:MAG: alpha/beta hydrolase [Burkholderiaceae bacterium]